MGLVPRVQFVKVHDRIMSSYPIGAAREDLKPLSELDSGVMAPGASKGLTKLAKAINDAAGDFRVTDCYRDPATQAAARQKYINWLNAGKPEPGSPEWDGETMKKDFVAEPGYSFHNAGRAIDIHIEALQFPNVPADKQLDKLWEIARPLGWRPVIKDPTEGVSESWHFDYMGVWTKTYDVLGYKEAAMCAGLDVGSDVYLRSPERALQAQLHRCGMNVGSVDGYVGKKTRDGLAALGLPISSTYEDLYSIKGCSTYKQHF